MEKGNTQSAMHQMPKQPNQPVVQPVATAQSMYKPVTQPAAVQSMYTQATQPVAKSVTKSQCESHMHRYVEVQAVDGYCYDGIVEHVDDEWICLAVPGSVEQMRGFFPPPPFYPPFGPVYPFRPRRFNRLVLPLAGLAAISLLPYYW